MPKKEKPNKPKTGDLPLPPGPGVSVPRITELDNAALEYVKERDKRMTQTPKEKAAKVKLLETIHKHQDKLGRTPEGKIIYTFDELIVEVTPGKENVKVRPVDHEEEAD